MIQAISVLILLAYVIASPHKHYRFKVRMLWFTGAILALIGALTVTKLPPLGDAVMLLIAALPLLLAFSYDHFRRR